MVLRCRLCRAEAVERLVDFGRQPIGSRFLRTPDEPAPLFPLVLAQCAACGLAQLEEAIPAEDLKPHFDWISYSEPEAHLDAVADVIMTLPGAARDRPVWGVSSKDDTLLERLARRGCAAASRLNPAALDLTVAAGVEQIQSRLTPESAARAAGAHERPGVLIARHLIEHAADLPLLLAALRELLAPGGRLVVEVPDCRAAFSRGDCTVMWEEHVLYFTAFTLPRVFAQLGLSPVFLHAYPYDGENVLVAIGRREATPCERSPLASPHDVAGERELLQRFVQGLGPRQRRLQAGLREHNRSGRVALFGAGHLGCTFINLAGLREEISVVIDENPHKQGLYMPGSRLPIAGPEALRERGVTLCLLAVQHAAAQSIVQRYANWVQQGGRFASIFAGSPLQFDA
jgi:hypothetical protein